MSKAQAAAAPFFEAGQVAAERYEILALIGYGSSGSVYRARDLYLDSPQEVVALKTIHPHLHGDRQIFGRARREAKILKRLEGPHLCRLFDYIEDEGLLMLSLELVDGPSLDSYLEARGALPVREVVEIGKQICSALQSAHEVGVIHRDLKPSNVLVEGARLPVGDGEPRSFLGSLSVRVVDFGLAKIVTGDLVGTALTEHDMIFGTPDYMAPEQVRGEELDHRCDLYAAAVLLYEMLVGEPPFERTGALSTMTAHLEDPVPPPGSRAPDRDIPRALEEVIMKALSKAPEDRFDSAREMAEALTQLDEAPDTDPQTSPAGVTDTHLENAQTAIHTTLPSTHKPEGEPVVRGGTVRVVVRDSASSSIPPAVASRPSHTPSSLGAQAGERRVWLVLAVLAALAAVSLGIFLGAR